MTAPPEPSPAGMPEADLDTDSLLALRPAAGFDLIMVDPPWRFATRSKKGITAKGAGGQYRTLTVEQIKALPIGDLAAQDCLLWLWATNPLLPVSFEIARAWGFTFKTAGHWAKVTRNGHLGFGTGYILRCAGEPFIIATRGRPVTTRSVRSVIMGPVRQHSRKPDEAFHAAERLMPAARRIEVFSRERRAQWATWGDEDGKFGAPEDRLEGV